MMTVEELNDSKPLSMLLSDLADVGTLIEVSGVAIDSRQVKPGDLFLAYRGSQVSGVDFIDAAVKAGAVAVAIDAKEQIELQAINIPIVFISDLQKQAGNIISRFYGEPSKAMQVIGVTGTNGKTTVSYMIAHALSMLGQHAGLIGTLGYGQFKNIESGETTTPDPVKLHSLFREWQGKLDSVAMEVSSHALDQGRVTGTVFDVAVFTNISRDHLDYHNSIEEYAEAKFQLFQYPGLKSAVINIDDKYGVELINNLPMAVKIIGYSTEVTTTDLDNVDLVYCEKIEMDQLNSTISLQSPWGQAVIQTNLLGQFNVGNNLAAFAALCASGISKEQAANALSGFSGIPGRMEYFLAETKPMLVVDYAHTPDALEQALKALRNYCEGQLYCVFGCGGDRDVGKRSQMGAIAENYADQIILTNDNPRSEPAEQIIEHILEGIKDTDKVQIKTDRSDAITNTFLNANQSDVVLIAGKGHETTQTLGKTILPFSDRELARRLTEGES